MSRRPRSAVDWCIGAGAARHRGLERAVEALTKQTVPAGAWLLVDGESPTTARWALGLALMFAGFAVWSVFTTMRLLRRVT